MARRTLVSVGVGATAFLLASVAGFEVFGSDFPSVFYVLPIALLAAIAATIGAYLGLRSRPGRVLRSGLTGTAAFSYTVFSLWFVRYSIAATRSFLSFDVIALVSVVVAAAVAALVWFSDSTVEGT